MSLPETHIRPGFTLEDPDSQALDQRMGSGQEQMSEKHLIRGVYLTDRIREGVDVQRVFTEFGCGTKTRIGLHDADGKVCDPGGVILLELVGGEQSCDKLVFNHEA